jgi:hypothetical protein
MSTHKSPEKPSHRSRRELEREAETWKEYATRSQKALDVATCKLEERIDQAHRLQDDIEARDRVIRAYEAWLAKEFPDRHFQVTDEAKELFAARDALVDRGFELDLYGPAERRDAILRVLGIDIDDQEQAL